MNEPAGHVLALTDTYLNATAALLNCVSRPSVDLADLERLIIGRDVAEAAFLAAVRPTRDAAGSPL
jgi:hypothetical protein